MKIFHSAIGVILITLSYISPILSYYKNDDSSKAGFVSVQNTGRSHELRGYRGMQRRHFAGSPQRHINDNIVDSHFKVKKTPPYQPDENNRDVQVRRWNTDAPIQKTKPDTEIGENTRRLKEPVAHVNQAGSVDKTKDIQPFLNEPRSRIINAEYRAAMPQRGQHIQLHNYQDIHQNKYDSKPNFVQMNVHKTQISTDPQKLVRLNNNQQINSISLHRPEEKYQKIPTSVVVDKTLQKVSAHNGHNAQIMSRVLDEITHKITDRKFKGEYRKRDTEYDDLKMSKNRNYISDTMRKYIIGKDKSINLERQSTKEFSRIGSHEESIESEGSPYAIFYRMHPDTLDEQEGYISMGSIEANSNAFTNKKKRFSVGNDNPVDLMKTKKKSKNNSAVKFHKKVKNFSNYRTLV